MRPAAESAGGKRVAVMEMSRRRVGKGDLVGKEERKGLGG